VEPFAVYQTQSQLGLVGYDCIRVFLLGFESETGELQQSYEFGFEWGHRCAFKMGR
jgi:hypothetical protein